jgi:hypothetical protein
MVSIRDGNAKTRCSIMLGCSLDGKKATPFTVFIGKDTVGGHVCRDCVWLTTNSLAALRPFRVA